MNKKSLLLGLAAMALAMTFIACESGLTSPDSITNTENAQSLSGPANLTARAYPGVNLITWDLHKDAANYSVYRKDTVTGITELIEVDSSSNSNTTKDTRYIDAVSQTNPLINGREYIYTVTANSGNSLVTRALDKNDSLIFDGASSAGVRANIPEIGTAVQVPTKDNAVVSTEAPDGISITPKTIDGSDFYLVKWTFKDDFFNNYKVSYVYGTVSGEPADLYNICTNTSVDDENQLSDYLTKEKIALIPAIGAQTLTFRVDGSFYTSGYYSDAHALKTFPTPALTVLDKVTTFTATRERSNVKLTWSDVENATSYDIYKAEIEGDTPTIVGPWTTVTVKEGSPVQGKDKGWSALEQNVAADKNYRYLIIAKAVSGTTTIRSKAPATADTTAEVTDKNDLNFNAEADWTVNNELSAKVSWTPSEGVTYELLRAEAIQVDTGLVAIEAYTSLLPSTALPSTTASSYRDTDVKKRHSYIYKLKVTGIGGTAEFTTDLKDEPFSNEVADAKLEVSTSTSTVQAITVKFSAGTTATVRDSDLSAEILRQQLTKDGAAIGAEVNLTKTLKVGESLEDTGLAEGTYYLYKLVLKSTENEMVGDPTKVYGEGTNNDEAVKSSAAGEAFTNKFNNENKTTGTDTGVFLYQKTTTDTPLLTGATLYKITKTGADSAALNTTKFSWAAKTVGTTISYKSSTATTPSNVTADSAYFEVSAAAQTDATTYAVDIYFVLGDNGLPYNISNSDGTYTGNVTALQISRIANNVPDASWVNVSADDIQW
ncbi:MAG: hypothetical protein LBK00_09585 [Treponema sp.]|nr:hypothetical protein [Treponema sp.]